MRSRYAVSRIAVVVGTLLGAPDALAHHSFAPHFDASKPVSISGTVTEFEARNPHSYLHSTRSTRTAGRGNTSANRTASRSSPATGSRRSCSKAGTKVRVTGSLSRHSPYMCFFDSVEFADGRTLERQRPGGARRRRRGAAAAQGHLRHLAARADTEPQHERPAADDSVPDAGRREGRRGLRSVQGRSDVPLRSGCRSAASGARPARRSKSCATAATSCCITNGWTCGASST